MAEETDKISEANKESNGTDDGKEKEREIDKSALRYVDGKCFYTDSSTGVEYEWNEEKQQWEGRNSELSEKDYTFDGETYYYTDKETNVKFKWNKEQNKWVSCSEAKSPRKRKRGNDEEEVDTDDDEEELTEKSESDTVRQDMSKGIYGTDGSTLTYTDTNDGTVYFWDKQKSAWFPKVDDDFLAHYQLSYGFTNPESNEDKKIVEEKEKAAAKQKETEDLLKKKAQEPAWFDVTDETNTKVYVSNLPLDITEQEFVDLMQKCGLVMKDPDTGKMKIKLYTEPGTDMLKGDALCTYIKVESVALALTLLDGSDYKGKKLHVERAKFTMKGGTYDPSLRPKKKKRKDKEKIKKMQEKLFDWRPEKAASDRAKHERVVIVKNLFDPSIFDKDVGLILEYQDDLRQECKKCGDVRKVIIYDRHPEGVAQITFKEFEAAEACVQLLEGRWFGQRKITAHIWDGKTKFKIAETEAEIAQRINKWDKFLEDEGGDGKDSKEKENDSVASENKETSENRDSDGTRSSAGSGDETDEGT